jgi:hypothetical protein
MQPHAPAGPSDLADLSFAMSSRPSWSQRCGIAKPRGTRVFRRIFLGLVVSKMSRVPPRKNELFLPTSQSSEPLVDCRCRSGDPPQYPDVTTPAKGCTGTARDRLCRQRKLMQIVFAGPVPVREEVRATECLPSGDLGTIPRRGASNEARKATTDVLYGCLSVDDPGRCDDRRDAAMITADILNALIHVLGQLPNSLAYSTAPTEILQTSCPDRNFAQMAYDATLRHGDQKNTSCCQGGLSCSGGVTTTEGRGNNAPHGSRGGAPPPNAGLPGKEPNQWVTTAHRAPTGSGKERAMPDDRDDNAKNDPDHTRLYSAVASALSRRIEAVNAESTARTALDAARKAVEVEEDQPARVSLFITREDRISEHHAAEHNLMEADAAWRQAVDELNHALQSG